jgi:enoyl-CoA hydratase/carnithine racemase
MVLSGDNIDGRRAFEVGLVDHLVSPSSFEQEVHTLVTKYLEICSEGTRQEICSEGTRQSKILLNMAFEMSHGQFFEEYLRRQRIALASPDHREAITAYLERRKPIFS